MEKNLSKKVKDIIKIEFENQFLLYWNCKSNEIIKDKNYFTILQNKNNIRLIACSIANQDIVCDNVCCKETALKKGDIAYLFLSENGFIYEYKCLGMQFDSFGSCKYPDGLLDYIEANRAIVILKVMECLDITVPCK